MNTETTTDFTVHAGERELRLEFDAAAIFDAAAALGVGVQQAVGLLNPATFSEDALRTFFWAGLQVHQPGIDLRSATNLLFQCNAELGPKLAAALSLGADKLAASPLAQANAAMGGKATH